MEMKERIPETSEKKVSIDDSLIDFRSSHRAPINCRGSHWLIEDAGGNGG